MSIGSVPAVSTALWKYFSEAYVYWAGEVGLVFARSLAEQAKTGIKVQLLLDAIGSASIGPEILETLNAGGCQVAWYNPIHW